tara:strand:+ start:630 stop:971 length:342 start_codon:yes stop_codon:yes gene_type:complete
MPTSRFVVVSAPLEERVTASIASRAQQALLIALRIKSEVNDSLHREDVGERAGEALEAVVKPGGVPFVVFMLLVAVLATRELLLRIETRRILQRHNVYSSVPVLAPTDRQHED